MVDREFDILLVEDDQDHAELIQRAFESSDHSYRLRVVGTLNEARSALSSSPPSLVITDLMLPDGRGVELIHSESEKAAFPVIVLTSFGNENVAVEAIKAGALDYVVKSQETLADMPHIAQHALREWEQLTGLKQAEAALRESEERFRKVFEEGPLGMALVGQDYRLVEVNPAFCLMLGYTEQELTAVAFPDITHPDDRNKDTALAEKLFRGDIPSYRIEKRYLKKNGEHIWANLTVSLIRDKDGVPRYGLGLVEDISDRRQAETALRNSEEQYRSLLENHVDGVAVIVDGKFYYVNERCCNIGGYTSQELLGRPILGFVADEDRPYAIKRMTAITKGEASIPHVYSYIRKDSTTVPVEVAGQLISFDGKPALLSVFRDITQRKRLEDEARQHREELAHVLRVSTMGEMATGLAHELNQPLTAISIFAAACRTTLNSNPAMKESEKLIGILEKIEAQSQRAGRVIDRISDLVRKRGQDRSSFPVNNPIQNVVSLVEQETRMNSVVVNLELDETIPEVVGDSIQIEQVILNLVRNGIEAVTGCNNGDPREMTLRTSQLQSGEIEVSISDTGPGVVEEARDWIFEAFASTKQNGLGMGLAISRTIIESHGGSLSFTPNSDRGSTFRFTLPTFQESSS